MYSSRSPTSPEFSSRFPRDTSHTSIQTRTDILPGTVLGEYPLDLMVVLFAADERNISRIVQVCARDGEVSLAIQEHRSSQQQQQQQPREGAGHIWLIDIQPARDRHEQNVEAYMNPGGTLSYQSVRHISKGEHLYVWYSDDLARTVNIPVLTPANIRGDRQYVCTECHNIYEYPNSLKSHLRFQCLRSPDTMRSPSSTLLLPPSGITQPYFSFSSRMLHKRPEYRPDTILTSISMLSKSTSPIRNEEEKSAFKPLTIISRKNSRELSSGSHSPESSSRPSEVSSSSSPSRSMKESPDSTTRQSNVDPRAEFPAAVSHPLQIFPQGYPHPLPLSLEHATAFKYYYPHLYGSISPSKPFYYPPLPQPHLLQPSFLHPPFYYPCKLHPKLGIPANERGKELGGAMKPPSPMREATPTPMQIPFPMPCEKEGEPIDLLPRSLYMSKSRKGHLCIYCGKLYSRKYGLKIHLRTHTGYKPLKCKVCLRPFGDPSNLNKHIRLHAEGDTPYRCEHCGKVLVRRRDLERHIKSRHPNEAERLEEKKRLEAIHNHSPQSDDTDNINLTDDTDNESKDDALDTDEELEEDEIEVVC